MRLALECHGPKDRSRVDVRDLEDAAYWQALFACSEQDLSAIVEEVGDCVIAVRDAVERRKKQLANQPTM